MTEAKPPKVSFHDATLESVRTSGNDITFFVVDARTQEGLPCSPRVILQQVISFKADGEFVDGFVMEARDAEILAFDWRADGIAMTLEWNDWEPHHQFVRSYEIRARGVQIDVSN